MHYIEPHFPQPLIKYHKDKCLSFPCAVKVEINSDWQMGGGHPVNRNSGHGDITASFSGQLITENSDIQHGATFTCSISPYCDHLVFFNVIFYLISKQSECSTLCINASYRLLHKTNNIQGLQTPEREELA